MVRIACVGITVMDRIYYVEGLPTEGGKYVAKRYTEVGGGPAATAAVAAAKLGAQVDFIGRVGDDDTGNSLLAELESLGVNTRYTRRYTQAMSSQSAIMVDAKGERIIVNYPSPDLLPDADWLNDIDFSQWDVVLADVRWHDGAKQAFTLARQAGVMTVLDGDITPQDISELVALSDHAAFSEPGLARLTGMSEAIDALKKSTNAHKWTCLCHARQRRLQLVGKSGGTPPTGFYRGGGGYYWRGRCFSWRTGIWPGKRIRHRRGCQIRQRRCRAEVYAPGWPGGYP